MRRITNMGIQLAVFIGAGVLPLSFAAAQSAPPSLEDQLSAEYQVVKVSSGPSGPAVSEPGTVLVVQKDGVFGVPPSGTAVCRSTFQGGKMDSNDKLCPAATKKEARSFKVGEKVYPSQIHVDLRNDDISFGIVACDTCNGTSPPTSFKSEVIFKFAKGYLQKAGVPEVEDTISEVFAVNNSANLAPPPAAPEPEEAGSDVQTNDTIMRMAAAKLGDAVILEKIKTSQCEFNTSTDALIKLRQAGVSDAVLQAMITKGVPSPPAPVPTPTAPETASTSAAAPTPSPSVPPCASFDSCLQSGRDALQASQWATALTDFQQASSMDPSKPEPVAEQGQVYMGAGQYDDAGKVWDNALALGGTLVLQVWHFAGLHDERGTFQLGPKELSFTGPGGQKIFSVAPAEASPVSTHHLMPRGWVFRMKVGNRNYNFSFVPVGTGCKLPSMCSDRAGYAQEEAVAKYIGKTVTTLASK
jgi:hypothetical protein